MKKLLIVSAAAALGLSTAVLAGGLPEEMPMAPVAAGSDAGVYLGVSGGYGLTHWKNLDSDVASDSGFVGRAFVGYDLNKYFAVEGGYTHFFNKAIEGFDVKTSAADLMFKLKAPVADDLDAYAKLGANYLMSKSDESDEKTVKNFNVGYGFGIDYKATSNIVANVEWLRFNGSSKITKVGAINDDYQPFTDAFMVGVRYKLDM